MSLLVTSLAKEAMFLVALVSLSVCLFVCLFVCGQHYSKSYERFGMKFYGRVVSSTRKNWLNFGGDLGIVRWVNEQKNTVIVVAYPDRGAGNDPEPFYLLGKGGYVFGSVGLFVCLSVDTITQNIINGLGWNFMEMSWVVQWRTD